MHADCGVRIEDLTALGIDLPDGFGSLLVGTVAAGKLFLQAMKQRGVNLIFSLFLQLIHISRDLLTIQSGFVR